MGKNKEMQAFNNAIDTILRADPKAVKEAMEAEKRANAEKRAQSPLQHPPKGKRRAGTI